MYTRNMSAFAVIDIKAQCHVVQWGGGGGAVSHGTA